MPEQIDTFDKQTASFPNMPAQTTGNQLANARRKIDENNKSTWEEV